MGASPSLYAEVQHPFGGDRHCRYTGAILLALLIFFPALKPAVAENLLAQPWQISADRITRYAEPQSIEAEGNVILTRVGGQSRDAMEVRADWARYDLAAGRVLARGNLAIHTVDEVLVAEEAVLDLNRQTGTLTGVTLSVQESTLRFGGRTVEKTGELSYRFQEGWVTACPAAPGEAPLWSIKSNDVNLKMEGYAVLKHATFNLGKIPVLYTPYLILPTHTTRKSGFLFPEISQSRRDGAGVIAPLFVNLSPSSDLTFYPGILGKRGLMAGMQYRYMASDHARGAFNLSYLADRTSDVAGADYKDDGFLRRRHDRYWLRGKIDHMLNPALLAKLDLDLVSDRDFLQEYRKSLFGFTRSNNNFLGDFSRGFQDATVSGRDSSLQLARSQAATFWGGEMRLVDDSGNDAGAWSQVQTLPRLLFNGLTSLSGSRVDLAWESEYVHYWREQGVSGHRLDLYPRLVAPLPLGDDLEGVVSSGIRHTAYQVEANGDLTSLPSGDGGYARTLGDFSINTGFSRQRTFQPDFLAASRLTHLVRPYLTYAYVEPGDQDHLPQFDVADRIETANRITYGIKNYFRISDAGGEGKTFNRPVGAFKISQAYDFRGGPLNPDLHFSQRRQPFSSVIFNLELYPVSQWKTAYETAWNIYGEGVAYYDLLTSYNNGRGHSLTANYRYHRNPGAQEPYFFALEPAESSHEIDLSLRSRMTERVYLEGDISRSLSHDRTVDASLRLLYQPSCWSMELNATKTPEDERVAVIFSLSGLGKVLEFGLE